MSKQIAVSEKHKALVLHHNPAVASVIPHAKTYTKDGVDYLIVPHRSGEVKLLRNLDYRPPAPILTQYNWANTTPYDHQKTTAAMLSTVMLMMKISRIDGEILIRKMLTIFQSLSTAGG